MALKYDDDIIIFKGVPVGDQLPDGYVFSWASDEHDSRDVKRVRVQAGESVVRDWGVNWFHDAAVRQAFADRRDEHLAAAALVPNGNDDVRIFKIRS